MTKINIIGWVATAFIIAATIVRAFDYSNFLDLAFTLTGCILWAFDGFRAKNNPLVFVNVFSIIVVTIGLWRYV